jgi:hypothetical protein
MNKKELQLTDVEQTTVNAILAAFLTENLAAVRARNNETGQVDLVMTVDIPEDVVEEGGLPAVRVPVAVIGDPNELMKRYTPLVVGDEEVAA